MIDYGRSCHTKWPGVWRVGLPRHKLPVSQQQGSNTGQEALARPTWNPHGSHMELTSNSHRTNMEPTWNPHGTHMVPTWNPHGTYMEPTWNSHGTHMEPTWKMGVRKGFVFSSFTAPVKAAG